MPINALMGLAAVQALGMPSKVMQESSLLSQPSVNIPDVTPKRSLAKRARSRPSRLLVDVPSVPAWEREVSESKLAQLQRSQSSVALAQRPDSFDDDVFEAQEAPPSGAAAMWEDIVEVSLILAMNVWHLDIVCVLSALFLAQAGPRKLHA